MAKQTAPKMNPRTGAPNTKTAPGPFKPQTAAGSSKKTAYRGPK